MLRSAGYECYLPDDNLKQELRSLGCDTVLDVEGLVKGWGYSQPNHLPLATSKMMKTTDLYVDIKAHRNGKRVWQRWPELKDRVLWYRINGCRPEHVVKSDGTDCGDEVNPGVPILTPNLWYRDDPVTYTEWLGCLDGPHPGKDWGGSAYTCWPPFAKWDQYQDKHGRQDKYSEPICLVHNVAGWGYSGLIPVVRDRLGIKFYGGGSPDGLIQHGGVAELLSKTIALVHLKSNDAPGYALYEALAAGCPVIVPRRLIWRSRMEELWEDGVTCHVFDKPTHDPLSGMEIEECTREISDALKALSNPAINKDIGNAGRRRLASLMWAEHVDGNNFREWMSRNFK
jgi:hypothetical protein